MTSNPSTVTIRTSGGNSPSRAPSSVDLPAPPGLLHSGIAALETGEIRVEVGEHRDELLQIKAGRLSFDEVKQRAITLDRQFQQAFERTALSEQPDFDLVDDFLIRV